MRFESKYVRTDITLINFTEHELWRVIMHCLAGYENNTFQNNEVEKQKNLNLFKRLVKYVYDATAQDIFNRWIDELEIKLHEQIDNKICEVAAVHEEDIPVWTQTAGFDQLAAKALKQFRGPTTEINIKQTLSNAILLEEVKKFNKILSGLFNENVGINWKEFFNGEYWKEHQEWAGLKTKTKDTLELKL